MYWVGKADMTRTGRSYRRLMARFGHPASANKCPLLRIKQTRRLLRPLLTLSGHSIPGSERQALIRCAYDLDLGCRTRFGQAIEDALCPVGGRYQSHLPNDRRSHDSAMTEQRSEVTDGQIPSAPRQSHLGS